MKSLKKTLVLLVVLSMLLSAISPVFAAGFSDEIDEAYWEHANKLAAVGVIKGDDDGNFNATSNITRAEMAVIICKMTGMTEATANASKNIPSIFEDVKAGEWYTGWINLAVDNGMIAGFPDGTFRPQDPLTTNQAITLVVKALGKGAYVDQMGTWPGNYVQEAAKLGLTTDMVDTGSDLANRGNVAILAWEALQVGTWDVVSTTLDGEVRLSESDSLIVKYFKDFVNEGNVKLVEDAIVAKVGKTTSELGANQIVLEKDDETEFDGELASGSIAKYIDAQKEPKKGAKEVTYVADNGDLVVYVPADVADVDGLINKKVDVLFGADNEVALLYVTEEVVDEAYVTSWNEKDSKITIGGETFKVKADAEVSVLDYVVAEADDEAALETIAELVEGLGIENAKDTFNRTVKADYSLDSKDRIEKINFVFSVNADIETVDGTLTIAEDVVKKVTSKGIIKGFAGNIFEKEVDELVEDEVARVIKDDVVADFDAIEEGDVVTVISLDGEIELVYVSSAKANGSVSKVKNEALTIDGDVYYAVLEPVINIDGEFDDAEAKDRSEISEFAGEDVELYLNFLGEVVGAIGTTESTGTVLGVVTNAPTLKYDDDDVEYLSVRILTVDGKKASYKVYNKKSNEDISDADAPEGIEWADEGIAEGTLVIFSADSNRKIESDEIEIPASVDEDGNVNKYDFSSNSDVEVAVVADLVGDESKNLLTDVELADGDVDDLKFNASTIVMNINADDTEIVKNGWAALINSDDEFAPINGDSYIFYKGSKVIYFVADFEDYQSSEAEYAAITDISYVKNSDDDKVWEVTLYHEGETVVYELADEDLREDINEGDFVEYTISDDEIDYIATMIAYKAIEDLEDADEIADYLADGESATILSLDDIAAKGQIVVDSIEDGWVIFSDDEDVDGDDEGDSIGDVEICEDGYVIYDLTREEMVDDIDDIIGAYVIGIELTDDDGAEIFVIVK